MENKLVKFYETELISIVDDSGIPFVAIKPICTAIGLDADSAVRNIKTHPILGDVACVYTVRDAINRENSMLCLPIQQVNGWLFSINIKKVKDEARENLIKYQRDCYKVLFDFFFGVSGNIISRQKQRFELLQDLRNTDSQIALLSNRKKEIYKQLDGIDSEIFVQLELFPQNSIA
jgi:hypothetical protein